MDDTKDTPDEKRFVQPPTLGPSQGTSPVFGVELAADEEVEWQWTHTPDGRSVVTGYQIRKTAPEPGFDVEGAVKELLWPRRRVGF